MQVAVERECIGTGGCKSKSAALRMHIKKSCEVGAVCAFRNLFQPSDGHLTLLREETYPSWDSATGCATHPCGSITENTKEKGGCAIPPNPKGIGFPCTIIMKKKTKKKGDIFIRSDGWVVSPEGMRRLKDGGMKGHQLAEAAIKEQIGIRHRVNRPLDRDAAEIITSVKGFIPRAVFLANAIMAAVERKEVS